MDEKHSTEGTLSGVGNATGNASAESTPSHATMPTRAPLPPFKSSPATVPSFARAPSPAGGSQTNGASPPSIKFELTSLIRTLPEPSRPPALKLVADVEQPANIDPASQVTPFVTQPGPPVVPITATAAAPMIAPVASQPAPSFTPFITPRPVPTSQPPVAKPPTSTPSLLKRVIHYAATTARFAAIALAAWLVTVMALIAAFRFIDPPQSMLMLTQRLSGQPLQHDWMPLEQISPNLRRAVITSEDGKFCRHWGFDLGEIRAAMRSTDGYGRGASTITQQLSKNLFLWNGKSYVRKGLEVPLTLAIEALWSKKRILEVYLNIAEWGPGVFGAEAAAQYYYNKPASQLGEREAALLAVSLPNPIARDASDPNPAIARRASTLQARMRVQGISYCALTPKKG